MGQPNSKLLLLSGSGDSGKLANQIKILLSDTYGMGNSVEMMRMKTPKEVNKSTPKNHTYDLVVGNFNDGETRVDVGRNKLFDDIRGKHVAIVKYMFTPKNGSSKSINDHIMEVRGVLNVIKHADTLKQTLVVPYLPYLRSHSIEKYAKKGFFQFDSLDMFMDDLHRGELNELVCIDPHSDKLHEVASKYNIQTHGINPFNTSMYINPSKLGLNNPELANKVLTTLQPFVEYFKKLKEKHKLLHMVSADDGVEKRVEMFARDCGLGWDNLAYREKKRLTLETARGKFKNFSEINDTNIDSKASYVIIDDMLDSGGTVNNIAGDLKSKGAKHVYVICSHIVAPDRNKIKNLEYIDKIFALDTILHESPEELHVEYVHNTAELLAADIYKGHMKLEESRF